MVHDTFKASFKDCFDVYIELSKTFPRNFVELHVYITLYFKTA